MSPSYRQQLHHARDVIREGGVVAYPTESCFGLGCNPRHYTGVKKILMLKRRSASKGLILIGADYSQFSPYVKNLPDELITKMASSWPSSTTWLVPAASWVPSWLKGNSDKIALRIPAHRLARQLCRYCGHALVSTSANRSGQRSARHAIHVRRIFSNTVDFIVDAKCGTADRPSTIIDLLSGKIMRPGS